MKMIRVVLVLALVLGVAGAGLAQEPGRYERKSVSYVDVLLLASPAARGLSNDQVNVLLDKVKEYIEMPRFDYNPLPEEMVNDFLQAARQQVREERKLTEDDIANLMEEHLVPKIVEILQAQMALRAEEVMDPSKRQSFLATKAKEVGYTLEEIEKVMNAAYIYIPFVNAFDRDKTDGGYKYNMHGGIIWYHVDMEGEEPQVELRIKRATFSMGCGNDDFAFRSLAKNFARNLQVATQEIPEFKLQGQIRETVGSRYGFDMGTREGIGLDKPFWVGEWVKDASGELSFQKRGWLRVKSVGDNAEDRTELSYAYPVKGEFAMYQTVVEYPRLPIDIATRFGAQQVAITEGALAASFMPDLKFNDYSGMAPFFEIAAQANLANVFRINQFWGTVGFNYSFPGQASVEEYGTGQEADVTLSMMAFHGGLMKKWYMRQLVAKVEARASYQGLTASSDLGWSTYETELTNYAVGAQINAGFEYALSPAFHFGITGGFRVFSEIDAWDVVVKNSDGDEVYNGAVYSIAGEEIPKIRHTGVYGALYLHYTPPSLPFDPFDYVVGLMQGGCD